MSQRSRQVVKDPVHGYRRLDPLPSAEEHDDFYRNRYYDLLRAGGRAPHLRRLMGAGPEAEGERDWLRETLYADVAHALRHHDAGPRVLDELSRQIRTAAESGAPERWRYPALDERIGQDILRIRSWW